MDASKIEVTEMDVDLKVVFDLYMISLKDGDHGVKYGRNSFDFEEGVLVFSEPAQTFSLTKVIKSGAMQGWKLLFHPDQIRNTHLGNSIDKYSFFSYDVIEALHLSESEEIIINNCIDNIKQEYESRIDNHSQAVIVSNLELLLNHCLRFSERQFNTRTSHHKDLLSRFEKDLKNYYKTERQMEDGLPSINYFSERACLSQHYFSDVIKKETGRPPIDHIHEFVVNKAKSQLMGTTNSVGEIAYHLGFNSPNYFTRLFKSKTGLSPLKYRQLN